MSVYNICRRIKVHLFLFSGGGEGSAHLPVMWISHTWTLSWTFWYWSVCVWIRDGLSLNPALGRMGLILLSVQLIARTRTEPSHKAKWEDVH